MEIKLLSSVMATCKRGKLKFGLHMNEFPSGFQLFIVFCLSVFLRVKLRLPK